MNLGVASRLRFDLASNQGEVFLLVCLSPRRLCVFAASLVVMFLDTRRTALLHLLATSPFNFVMLLGEALFERGEPLAAAVGEDV